MLRSWWRKTLTSRERPARSLTSMWRTRTSLSRSTASRVLAVFRTVEGGAPATTLRAMPLELRSAVERDRRASVERTIELGRWLVLILTAASANFPSATRNVGAVNLILGAWALFNLAL